MPVLDAHTDVSAHRCAVEGVEDVAHAPRALVDDALARVDAWLA